MKGERRLCNHLLWRAGFGPVAQQHFSGQCSLSALINHLTDANLPCYYLDYSDRLIDRLQKRAGMGLMERTGNKIARRLLFIGTNHYWLQTMIDSKNDLHERMTLFWAGLFACQNLFARQGEDYINTIREHALGYFPKLLSAVSRHPAMLRFLNNQQNRKEHPNENFAREVMELFTLGRGHYTERDVREAARAFTGWGFDKDGNFVFRKAWHDDGIKEFLGQKGHFTGDDILRILTEQKQCARYLCTRIYIHFVNDQPDEKIIASLADRFYHSGYNIHNLMQHIFKSPWFYDERNIGVKVKSPVVLLVNLCRNFNIRFVDHRECLRIQRVLGQVLLMPPNVGGWPEGKNWIDSSTLLYRLSLPSRLLKATNLSLNPKQEFDVRLQEADVSEESQDDQIRFVSDTQPFEASFAGLQGQALKQAMMDLFIQTGHAENLLNGWKGQPSTALEAALHVMSLPEFQLS
jgi:uncharacterized protein (DUF1800 family)